ADEVETGHGRLESPPEPGIASVANDLTDEVRRKEVVLSDVDLVARREENVVHDADVAAVERHLHMAVHDAGGVHGSGCGDGDLADAREKPRGGSGADRPLREWILKPPRNEAKSIRKRDQPADAGGTNVGRCVE